MNNRPDNPAQVHDPGEMENQTHELQTETLIEFARDYFATDFPNPDQRGCPDRASLGALARAGRLPDDELRAHLFGCSDCFNEYRAALATRTFTAPAAPWWAEWRDKLVAAFTLRPGFAWASVAMLLLAVILLTWARWHGGTHHPLPPAPPETIQARAPNSVPTPISPTPEARVARNVEPPAPQSNPATQRRTAAADAVTTVSVDLNEYVALRDVSEASGLGKKVIQLAAVWTRLKLRLPEGSLAGVYRVSLVDDLDQPVISPRTVRSDGNFLVTTLDLRSVGAKSFRLRLQCVGEAPDFYAVQFSPNGFQR